MTELSPEICFRIKEARKAAKLSQSVVAAEVGCKQSALSMFEQGDGTKLNDEVVERLAKKFSVDLKAAAAESKETEQVSEVLLATATAPATGYCPNPHCPSNQRYEIDGRTFAKPDRQAADPVGGKFCAICGEVLLKRCPNCGSPVHEGSTCSYCGEPYVTVA